MTERTKISAFLVCMNEEEKIERALNSIEWCDEIVIIDSGSTDKTLEIASKYTDKIIHNDWPGFVVQKRFGLSKCSENWVLNIDADEEVSPELKEEIIQILEDDAGGKALDGYEMNRVVYYLGKWWRKGGWYPEYRLRLLRRSKASWGGENPHEKAMIDGKIARLKGELFHFTYDSIDHQIQVLNRHSSASAEALYNKGKPASILKIIFNPPTRFLKFYFLKRGFLEGFPGFIVAVFEAFYAFLKYIKLWEIHRRAKNKP